MAKSHNPRLKALILEVVDNQINDNDPPITRETMARLQAAGYSEKKAKEMIGSVVAEYIWDTMANGTEFNVEKYSDDLRKLR